MIFREYDCAGCEHCILCGKDKGYDVVQCDFCHSYMSDEKFYYLYGDENLICCPKCLIDEMIKAGELIETEMGILYENIYYTNDEELLEIITKDLVEVKVYD